MPLSKAAVDLLKQDIVFRESLRGQELEFHSTWGLFSPRAIDDGTRLLLEHLPIRETDDCLDLGCGYGPLGLVMARLAPRGQTLLLDKDFVAIQYSQQNCARNGIHNASARLSNGFSAVESQERFDLIVSNIPAKVGKELLSIYLHDAHQHLRPEGWFYVVTINGLREFMKRNLLEVFGHFDKVKQGAHYTVSAAQRSR